MGGGGVRHGEVENGEIEQGKHAGDGLKGDGGNVGGCQWIAAVQVEAEMERWEEERGRLEEVKGRLEHFHSQVGGGTGGWEYGWEIGAGLEGVGIIADWGSGQDGRQGPETERGEDRARPGELAGEERGERICQESQ